MRLLIVFAISLRCFAALSVTVQGTTQTQAILNEYGAVGDCTIEVSESPTYSPLHPDVDGTLHPGASTDTGRPDKLRWADGTRIVTLGLQRGDRALAAYTLYYWRVSGCGGTVTGTFMTANLSAGTTRTEATPYDSTKWGNLAFPDFDWHTVKTYIDPLTGARLTPMALSTLTWRTGGGGNGAVGGFSRTFTDYAGGTGWTNPSGVLSGAATNASTSNTNPLDLYLDLETTTGGGADPIPYAIVRTLEDIGVVLWGSGTGSTTGDRTVDLCIFTSPVAGCASNVVPVVLSTGSVAAVPAPASTDPDAAWPAAFPRSPFFGWTGRSTDPLVRMENRGTFGTASVSGHNLILGGQCADTNKPLPCQYSHFSSALVAGNKIYVQGSSCVNSLCTIASVADAANATLSEDPGLNTSTAATSVATTGSINASSSTLTVVTSSGFFVGDVIRVAGAAAAGGVLDTTIGGISGTVITLNSPAITTVSGAVVTEMQSVTLVDASAAFVGGGILLAGTGGGGTDRLAKILAVSGSIVQFTGSVADPAVSATTTLYVPFHSYGWGIRIAKHTATGSATIGAQIKMAGSNYPTENQPIGDKCNYAKVTSGDGKVGNLCVLTASSQANYIAFVAQDNTVRLLMELTLNISFDPVHGNIWYAGPVRNADNSYGVSRYTYTGDYVSNLLPNNYGCAPDGGCAPFPVCSGGATTNCIPMTVDDLMPHSANADLDQQIVAKQGTTVGGVTIGAYDSTLYGTWTQDNSAIGFAGISGSYAMFDNEYSGQSQSGGGGGPGFIAVVDLSTFPAQVVNLIHTLDGTGNPLSRWGGLHSFQPIDARPNTFLLSTNTLRTNNTTIKNGGPFQAQVLRVLGADGVTWKTDTSLPWPPDPAVYYGNCPSGTALYTDCVTFLLPPGGPCSIAPTAAFRTAFPCPWNFLYSQYPVIRVDDNAMDLGINGILGNFTGDTTTEHFHILTTTPITVTGLGTVLKVEAARNSGYFYCAINPWHGGTTNPWAAPQQIGQVTHYNGWTLTMAPGSKDTCGDETLIYDGPSGVSQEIPLSGHFSLGPNANGHVNWVTATDILFNTTFASLGAIPFQTNRVNTTFAGNPSRIGAGQIQSYTSNEHLTSGPKGYTWSLDSNAFVDDTAEVLSSGPPRALSPVAGDVWQLQEVPTGISSTSNVAYKTQPWNAWAGKWTLHDVSGTTPGIIDSSPYGICYAYFAGECHSGSTQGKTYINLPKTYDWRLSGSQFCSASVSYALVPCLIFGNNAPADNFRQFDVSHNDPTGRGSRAITSGWSSPGRHYPYTHATIMPDGDKMMLMGQSLVDGFNKIAFLVDLPPFQLRSDPANDFKYITVQVPAGPAYAEIEFGYSRYGLPESYYCTARAEPCKTSTNVAPFAFMSESSTATNCTTGCTISVPVVAPNVVYYRVRRSADGTTWTASSETLAVALP